MSLLFVVGWTGTCLYLCSHSYICYKKRWSTSVYYGLNFCAAILVTLYSLNHFSWQAVAINVFWALISLVSYFSINFRAFPFSLRMFDFTIWMFIAIIIIVYLSYPVFIYALMGWSSVFVFTAAYLLFSVGRMQAFSYFLWSAYAALAILPQLWIDKNLAVFTLEVIWAGVSLLGAMRILYVRGKAQKTNFLVFPVIRKLTLKIPYRKS